MVDILFAVDEGVFPEDSEPVLYTMNHNSVQHTISDTLLLGRLFPIFCQILTTSHHLRNEMKMLPTTNMKTILEVDFRKFSKYTLSLGNNVFTE